MLYRLVKRGFDVLSSALALVVLSPLFLIVCIAIKLSSKGPVFYISERTGRGGALFRMLKFRSMHIRQEGAVESKYLVNEKRIFKLGKFIRKSKIDELPQLINVLRGDMSIVGPRPYPKKFTDRYYTGAYAPILSVRPGLACLDSLYDYAHGELFVTDEKEYARSVLPVRTELARDYVEKNSIGTDARIILRTIGLIFEIVVMRKREFKYSKTEQMAVQAVQRTQPENA